jgi:hypothetical protein
MIEIGQKIMTASVSVVEMFRRWEHEGEEEWSEFLEHLAAPQSPQMKAGDAFHAAIEGCGVTEGKGEFLEISAKGYLFNFEEFDGELTLGQLQEMPVNKMYGPLLIRGRCDDVSGGTITDYKLTFSSFDADRYLESYQWRFYMDILKCHTFVYQVFEGYDNYREGRIDVRKLHTLKLYRYEELHNDCQRVAERFYEVALRHPQIAKLRDESEL